jgi:glycosyltransferase involved in cell wall biosynthesis
MRREGASRIVRPLRGRAKPSGHMTARDCLADTKTRGDDCLHILYICRAVDESARVTAVQVRWISAIAGLPQVARLTVLTSRLGSARLPSNVSVRTFDRGSWPRLVRSFYREVLRSRIRTVSCFFVVQGGPYPALLLPLKTLLGVPIYHWKAQPHTSRKMRFYARVCDDLVFTATEKSLPLDLPKKRVIGHGIDTELFRPVARSPDRDFIVLGRVSPIKRIDLMVQAVAAHRELFGHAPTLDIVGPVFSSARQHADDLRALVDRLELTASVRFLEAVEYDRLPELLPRYRGLLNFSGTAFDKSVGEAMACGVPVLSSNPCVEEDLPPDLHAYCVVPATDVHAQAAALRRLLALDETTRSWLGQRVREHVVEHHGLRSFAVRLIGEIEADLSVRHQRRLSRR